MEPTQEQKTCVAGMCIMYGKQNVHHHAPDRQGRIRVELDSLAGTHIWYVRRDGTIDVSAGVTQTLFDAPPQPRKPRNAQDL